MNTDEFLPASRFSLVQLLILALCMGAAMIDGFDILVIAFTAPAIIGEWQVPPSQMGMIFSAGLLGMTLGSIFLGAAADVFGRRLVCIASLLLAGLGTCAVYLSTSVEQMAALRLLSGLGMGALLTALPTLTREFSPPKHRNLVVAMLMASTSLGGVLGGMLTASLTEVVGWRGIFLGAGMITASIGVLFHLIVPESPAFIASRAQRAGVEATLARVNRVLARIGHPSLDALPPTQAAAKPESATVKSLLTPVRRANTLLAWMTFFFSYATIYFLTSWLPKILVDAGMSQQEGIRGAVVLTAGAIAGTVLVAWLSKRWPLSRLITVAFGLGSLLIAAFSFLVGDAATSAPQLLWVLIFVIGMLLNGAFPNLYSVALTLYPTQVRSTGLGWCIGLGRCGAVLSPMVAGALIGMGMSGTTMLQLFVLPTLVATACVGWIRMREA